jgi:hypothetical protein
VTDYKTGLAHLRVDAAHCQSRGYISDVVPPRVSDHRESSRNEAHRADLVMVRSEQSEISTQLLCPRIAQAKNASVLLVLIAVLCCSVQAPCALVLAM